MDTRVNLKVAISAKIGTNLAVQTSFEARYDNRPAPLAIKNVMFAPGYVPAAQPLESLPAVRPGPQLPPAPDQRFPAGGRQRYAVPGEHAGQRLALEGIEVAPRGVLPGPVHRGLIRAAPVVHDGRPVGVQAGPGRGRLRDADQAGSPVHQRSEDVEQQDAHRLHSRQCATPAVGTRSRATPKCSR